MLGDPWEEDRPYSVFEIVVAVGFLVFMIAVGLASVVTVIAGAGGAER